MRFTNGVNVDVHDVSQRFDIITPLVRDFIET